MTFWTAKFQDIDGLAHVNLVNLQIEMFFEWLEQLAILIVEFLF